jgi:hypothetical protein
MSPRRRIMALLAEAAEDHPELGAAEVAAHVARLLPDDDRQLVETFLVSEFNHILAFELRMQFSRTRHGFFGTLDLRNPDAPPITELSAKRQDTIFERIEAMREFVPSQNRTLPLLDLTRSQLSDSIDFDLSKAFHFGFKAILKERLMAALPDDTKKVGEVFSAEQIVDLSQKIKKEMNRGNFRLAFKPLPALSGQVGFQGPGHGRRAQGPGRR